MSCVRWVATPDSGGLIGRLRIEVSGRLVRSCDRALTAAAGVDAGLIERAGFGTLCLSHYEFLKLSTEPGVVVQSFVFAESY